MSPLLLVAIAPPRRPARPTVVLSGAFTVEESSLTSLNEAISVCSDEKRR